MHQACRKQIINSDESVRNGRFHYFSVLQETPKNPLFFWSDPMTVKHINSSTLLPDFVLHGRLLQAEGLTVTLQREGSGWILMGEHGEKTS